MHREGEVRVGVRHDLDRPGVGADDGHAFLDQIGRGLQPDAGAAGVEGGVVGDPVAAPAGVDQHDVAFGRRADALFLKRRFDVGDRDFLACIHRPAPHGGDVEDDAAGEEGLHMLHAQRLDAVGPGDFGNQFAIVEPVALFAADADMRKAVELGANLADLGGEEIVHPDHVIRRERPARQPAGAAQRKGPRAKERHFRLICAADRKDRAGLHQRHGLHRLGRGHQVGRAGLIVRPVFRLGPVGGVARRHRRSGEERRGQAGGDGEGLHWGFLPFLMFRAASQAARGEIITRVSRALVRFVNRTSPLGRFSRQDRRRSVSPPR